MVWGYVRVTDFWFQLTGREYMGGGGQSHQLFLLPFLYLEQQLLSAPITGVFKKQNQLRSFGKQLIIGSERNISN